MPSDHDVLERQMADVDLRPFTLDEFHDRRHRKERNRRTRNVVLGVVLGAIVVAGALRSVGTDSDQKTITSDVPNPNRPSNPFLGEWASTDADGSSQTLVISRTDGGTFEVVLHDESAAPCSDGPSTERGTGALRSGTELGTQLRLTCDDGTPSPDPGLAELTFVYVPATGELVDNIGVVWRKQGTPAAGGANPALEAPSPYPGTWVVGEAGQYFPDVLEIRLVGDGDRHEVVMRKAETAQCEGGASTMGGTGSRAVDREGDGSVVRLQVEVRLTCDDGSTPVPQTAAEEVILDEFGISFTHDPATDTLQGSLGSTFVRQSAG